MADQEKQTQIIDEFVSINPINKNDARFFLEASNWDLNLALSNSYDNRQIKNDSDPEYEAEVSQESAPSSPIEQQASSSPQRRSERLPQPSGQRRSVRQSEQKSATTSYVPKKKIATLNYDSDDSEKEKQDWYTGGEKSGLNVLAPGSEGDGQDDLVQKILKKAQQQLPFEEGSNGNRRSARNKGKRMINTLEDSESHEEEEGSDLETVTRTLHIWRNGFSIEDGALYSFNDPKSQAILQQILQGQAPLDILNVKVGQPVELVVSKKSNEDFVQQKPKLKAFQGKGSKLSSSTPAAAPSAHASEPSDLTLDPLKVNEELPTTKVLVNLADGTRLAVKVNLTNTINQLKAHVSFTKPNVSNGKDFTLKTAYPVRILTQLDQTIEEANLANSVEKLEYRYEQKKQQKYRVQGGRDAQIPAKDAGDGAERSDVDGNIEASVRGKSDRKARGDTVSACGAIKGASAGAGDDGKSSSKSKVVFSKPSGKSAIRGSEGILSVGRQGGSSSKAGERKDGRTGVKIMWGTGLPSPEILAFKFFGIDGIDDDACWRSCLLNSHVRVLVHQAGVQCPSPVILDFGNCQLGFGRLLVLLLLSSNRLALIGLSIISKAFCSRGFGQSLGQNHFRPVDKWFHMAEILQVFQVYFLDLVLAHIVELLCKLGSQHSHQAVD
ncbi:UBX domain-containing protein 3 [Smittium culicis]|uniref:UBX domain-containing protein 3 n=1 Tax=Smittium culicis TaxID=133412 RepID=A0A1R1YTG6_9FUNG|nr:UBX domain-containing protein 3 [Smittium culicis]